MGLIQLDNDRTYLVYDYDKAPGTIMVKHVPSGNLYFVPFHDLQQDREEIETVHRIMHIMLLIARGRSDFVEDLEKALQPYKVVD